MKQYKEQTNYVYHDTTSKSQENLNKPSNPYVVKTLRNKLQQVRVSISNETPEMQVASTVFMPFSCITDNWKEFERTINTTMAVPNTHLTIQIDDGTAKEMDGYMPELMFSKTTGEVYEIALIKPEEYLPYYYSKLRCAGCEKIGINPNDAVICGLCKQAKFCTIGCFRENKEKKHDGKVCEETKKLNVAPNLFSH